MAMLPTDHRVCPPWCDPAQCVTSAIGIHHRSHLAVWYADRAQFTLGIHREDTTDGPGFAEVFLTISTRDPLPGTTIALRPDEARDLAQRVADTAEQADTHQHTDFAGEPVPELPAYLRDLPAAAEEIGKLRYWLGRAMSLAQNTNLLTGRQRGAELREIARVLHRPDQS